MRTLLIVAALVLGVAGSVRAEAYYTGIRMHKACSGEVGSSRMKDFGKIGAGFLKGFCNIYVAGVMDSLVIGAPPYCAPPNTNINQARKIFASYLAEHPESRHLNAARIIISALSEAFPCK